MDGASIEIGTNGSVVHAWGHNFGDAPTSLVTVSLTVSLTLSRSQTISVCQREPTGQRKPEPESTLSLPLPLPLT